VNKFFITVAYSGLSPKAPGTVGSFVSLILAIILLQYITTTTLFLLALLLSVIAVKVIDRYEIETGIHDAKEIVIDELSGMWITLCVAGISNENMFFTALFGFIYFRVFDIWKPSIIGKIDQKVPGGWGVMGDDMVAGVFAGISTALTYQLLI
jgi:phosphatidylglycerophosphatase A